MTHKLKLPAVTIFAGENINDIFEKWENECSDCLTIYRDDGGDIWTRRSICRYWNRISPCELKRTN
jgi:hypothetical protein